MLKPFSDAVYGRLKGICYRTASVHVFSDIFLAPSLCYPGLCECKATYMAGFSMLDAENAKFWALLNTDETLSYAQQHNPFVLDRATG